MAEEKKSQPSAAERLFGAFHDMNTAEELVETAKANKQNAKRLLTEWRELGGGIYSLSESELQNQGYLSTTEVEDITGIAKATIIARIGSIKAHEDCDLSDGTTEKYAKLVIKTDNARSLYFDPRLADTWRLEEEKINTLQSEGYVEVGDLQIRMGIDNKELLHRRLKRGEYTNKYNENGSVLAYQGASSKRWWIHPALAAEWEVTHRESKESLVNAVAEGYKGTAYIRERSDFKAAGLNSLLRAIKPESEYTLDGLTPSAEEEKIKGNALVKKIKTESTEKMFVHPVFVEALINASKTESALKQAGYLSLKQAAEEVGIDRTSVTNKARAMLRERPPEKLNWRMVEEASDIHNSIKVWKNPYGRNEMFISPVVIQEWKAVQDEFLCMREEGCRSVSDIAKLLDVKRSAVAHAALNGLPEELLWRNVNHKEILVRPEGIELLRQRYAPVDKVVGTKKVGTADPTKLREGAAEEAAAARDAKKGQAR